MSRMQRQWLETVVAALLLRSARLPMMMSEKATYTFWCSTPFQCQAAVQLPTHRNGVFKLSIMFVSGSLAPL